MPDREKVINQIDVDIQRAERTGEMLVYVGQKTAKDAFALLKGQDAEGKWIYGEDETGVDGWHCSECNFFEPWFYEFTDDIDFIRFYGFCPSCGRKMTSYTGKPTQEGR